MLNLFLKGSETEAGVSRRRFLRVGTLGLFGLNLPDWMSINSQARARDKPALDCSVIQIILGGGPSQLDTYDPKPDAQVEFRGEFSSIATNVSGVRLSEMLPRQARIMDKLTLIRSLHHTSADHAAGSHWMMTGHEAVEANPRVNDRPSTGSVASRLRGANVAGIPAYVTIPHSPAFSQAAYLGPGFGPFSLDGDPQANPRLRTLDLHAEISLEHLGDRLTLLKKLDSINRQRDISGAMEGMDQFTAEAYAMITGPRARRAFDLTLEDAKLRDQYGRSRIGQGCLLARRLVEAGVTFVTINEDGWDHHRQVFSSCRKVLPPLDVALAALVNDLHSRGLDKRVLVLVWGEFGRTPRVNGNGGRDHWPNAFTALLAGGGLKTGQVIGASGRNGEAPTERPLRPEDVIRTLYAFLGIDPLHEFNNAAGRPLAVLSQGQAIAELF